MPLLVLEDRALGIGDGSTDLYLPGSGLAFPGGIECPLEYNGLIFNTIHTVDKIRVQKIDGLADADVRDSRDVNPSSDGETPGNAFYGGRTLVLSGRIEAGTLNKLRDMQMALRIAFSSLVEKPLIFRVGLATFTEGDVSVRFLRDAQIFCRKSQPMAWTDEQVDGRFFRDFMITLRASNFRFISYGVEIAQHHFSSAGPASAVLINPAPHNRGSFSSQPVIDLIGPMTTPVLKNLTVDQNISLSTTIPDGVRWTIDIGAKTVEDQDGVNQFRYLSVDSDMWELETGINQIQLDSSAVGVGAGVVIKYRHTWL